VAVFWVVALGSLVEVYRCSRGHCCLRHRHLMETAHFSEMLVNFYLSDCAMLQPRGQRSSNSCFF
jgi:hypothetical protein